MQKDEGGSGNSWSISEINVVTSELDNIVNVPAVSFASSSNENNHSTESSLRPTLFIGLDKNFFESGDDARDVIYVENTEIKLDHTEIKLTSPDKNFLPNGNYVISFVDTAKDSSWETNLLKCIKFKQEGECSVGSSQKQTVATVASESFILEPHSNVNNDCKNDFAVNCFNDDDKLLAPLNANFEAAPFQTGTSTLPEKSLPIKKKAKMKELDSRRSKDKRMAVTSATPSTSKATIKLEAKWQKRVSSKRRCCYSDSDSSDNTDHELTEIAAPKFTCMTDVVSHLKDVKLIDDDFAELINAGLLEMNVDIFTELTKMDDSEPSYQLLTFAFLLRFKRPSAYYHLGRIFCKRWPTKPMLSKWRALVNSKPKAKRRKGKAR